MGRDDEEKGRKGAKMRRSECERLRDTMLENSLWSLSCGTRGNGIPRRTLLKFTQPHLSVQLLYKRCPAKLSFLCLCSVARTHTNIVHECTWKRQTAMAIHTHTHTTQTSTLSSLVHILVTVPLNCTSYSIHTYFLPLYAVCYCNCEICTNFKESPSKTQNTKSNRAGKTDVSPVVIWAGSKSGIIP